MCRLCGKDRPPYNPTRNMKGSDMYEYRLTVFDYTGEYPCKQCLLGIHQAKKAENYSMDAHIIKKLLNTASNSFTKKERANCSARINRDNADRESATISKNIIADINKNSGLVSYRVVSKCKHVHFSRTFHDIVEAITYRDSILNIKEKYKKPKGKQTKIKVEKNIFKITMDTTGTVSYQLKISNDNYRFERTVQTLEEARNLKKYIHKNGAKKHGKKVSIRKTETASECITKIYGKKTTYNVKFVVNNKTISKNFTTLSKAKQYRDKNKPRPKKPLSGYYGVVKNHNKWAVRISTGKHSTIRLGQYSTKQEAAKIYNKYIKENKIDKPLNNIYLLT